MAYEGYGMGEQRQTERAAWMLSWILATQTKNAPTMDELLGRDSSADEDDDPEEKARRVLAKIEQQRAETQTERLGQ